MQPTQPSQAPAKRKRNVIPIVDPNTNNVVNKDSLDSSKSESTGGAATANTTTQSQPASQAAAAAQSEPSAKEAVSILDFITPV